MLEIRARDERREKLAAEQGIDPEELKKKEMEAAEARMAQQGGTESPKEVVKAPVAQVSTKKKSKMISFEEKEDEDDIF